MRTDVAFLLAGTAGEAVVDGLLGGLAVVGIAAAFGVVYWLVRRRAAAKEDEKRRAWLEERRAKRGVEKGPPPAA
jgi:Na+/proline symporter